MIKMAKKLMMEKMTTIMIKKLMIILKTMEKMRAIMMKKKMIKNLLLNLQ